MRIAFLGLLAACYQSAPAPTPVTPTAQPAVVTPHTPQPTVQLATLFYARPDDVDGQELEGWPQFAYANFPAVSADGALVAVVEERDGWGHRPVPGIRLLAAGKATSTWLPLVPRADRPASEADELALRETFDSLVAAANTELARHTWRRLAAPAIPSVEDVGTDHSLTWAIGDHTLVTTRANYDDNDVPRPPTKVAVLDRSGRAVVTLTDTERTWGEPNRCNLSVWKLVGTRETPGVALFHLELGMGGHNCDGVEQPHEWRIVAF